MKKQILLITLLMALFAPLAMNGQQTAVLNDGTTTTSYVPFYGLYADYGAKGQFIIPATDLANKGITSGSQISKLKFFSSATSTGTFFGTSVKVEVGEVSYTSFSSNAFVTSGLITVLSGTSLSRSSDGTMVVSFSSNYTYTGGNLLISIGGYGSGCPSTSWYGVSSTNAGVYGYNSSNNQTIPSSASGRTSYAPKTEITYLPGNTPYISLTPASATVFTDFTETLTATYGNVSGTPTITYSSSNTNVATVSGSGTTATVTAVAPGTATITASMTYQGTTYTATCAITVEDPSYCTPGTGNYDGSGISNVTFGTNGVVVNNTVGGIAYGNYSNLVGAVEAGTTCQVNITYKTGYTYGTIIWVDWDHSYTFEGSEAVYAGTSGSANPTTLNATFDVPATTQAGDYRMRIIGSDSGLDNYTSSLSAAANADPCGSYNYSTCHDYTLRVNAASACPAPTNLTATNLMPTSATLNWEGDAESYNVRYRATSSGFSYNFETATPWAVDNFSPCTTYDGDGSASGSIQDVTFTNQGYTGSFIAFQNGVTTNAASHSGNAFGACFFATTPANDDYFILPAITIESGYVFKFWAKSFSSSYRESFRAGVYNGNGNLTAVLGSNNSVPNTWTEYSYNLSSYVGQTIQLAIHCNSNDCFAFFIDDIFVGDPNFIPTWSEPITGVTSPYILTGLDPETEYEFQVQADCGTEGESSWSASATFTTPDGCAVPTGLTAEVTGNAAELSWTGAQENYNVHYREVDPTVPATIILNVPTDIWNDGSGYQMLLDADATAYYGNDISDYSIFEYLIPTNATYDPNTTGFVINSSVTIQIPAGTYDWFITNPSPGDKVYVAASNGNVGGSQNNYVFEAGKTYEFVPSLYGQNDGVDVTITAAWTLVEGVNNPYLLENLSSQTTYEYQVQGVNCDGNGGTTDWSASATFTTPESYTKDIKAYTTNGGYYLIASPLASPVTPANVTNMISNTYDLYRFNQSNSATEWENYKKGHFTTLENGKGYLYANSNNVTLVFTGAAYNGNGKIDLTQDASNTTRGNWNLVGNPYPETATVNVSSFYVMNGDGSDVIGNTSTTVAAMEGIFVLYDSENNITSVTFTPGTGSKSNEQLTLNITQGRSNVIDRAIVRFDGNSQLPKFQLFETSTKLYIPQGTQDFAVVNAEAQGEMPVNFKAKNNGTYTVSVNTENVEFNYLHLIDNMTGADIDLLETPSYSFEANTSDYESRFKLVFAQGNSSNSDNFAFVSNDEIIVNGEGLLQMFDVTGRTVYTAEVNSAFRIPNSAFTAGVYVLKLNDKTQKIVVK